MARLIIEEEPIDDRFQKDAEDGKMKKTLFEKSKDLIGTLQVTAAKQAGIVISEPDKGTETQAETSDKVRQQYARMKTRSSKAKGKEKVSDAGGNLTVQPTISEGLQIASEEGAVPVEDFSLPENLWAALPDIDVVQQLTTEEKSRFKKNKKVQNIPFTDPVFVCEIKNETTFTLEGVSYTIRAYDEMVLRCMELYYGRPSKTCDCDTIFYLCHAVIYYGRKKTVPKAPKAYQVNLKSLIKAGLSSVLATLAGILVPAAYYDSKAVLTAYPSQERVARLKELRAVHYRLWYAADFFATVMNKGLPAVEPIPEFVKYDKSMKAYIEEIAVGTHTVDELLLAIPSKDGSMVDDALDFAGQSEDEEMEDAQEEEEESSEDEDMTQKAAKLTKVTGQVTKASSSTMTNLNDANTALKTMIDNAVNAAFMTTLNYFPPDIPAKIKQLEATCNSLEGSVKTLTSHIVVAKENIRNLESNFTSFMAKTASVELKEKTDINKALLSGLQQPAASLPSSSGAAVNPDLLLAQLTEAAPTPQPQAFTLAPQREIVAETEKLGNQVLSLLVKSPLPKTELEELKRLILMLYPALGLGTGTVLVASERFKMLGTRVTIADRIRLKMKEKGMKVLA